jgi:hypothetical protein
MRSTPRRAAAAVAALAAVLALPGCGSGSAADEATPTSPAQVLTAALRGIDEGNFRFAVSYAGSGTEGAVHEPSRSAAIVSRLDVEGAKATVDLVHVGSESWLKWSLGEAAAARDLTAIDGRWLRLDPARVEDAGFGDLGSGADPAGVAGVVAATRDVVEAGDSTYTGVVDLAKAAQTALVDPGVVTALGDKAGALPFIATVDGQRRLSTLLVDVPPVGRMPAGKLEFRYFDYGAVTAMEKPGGRVIEAPPSAYELLKR